MNTSWPLAIPNTILILGGAPKVEISAITFQLVDPATFPCKQTRSFPLRVFFSSPAPLLLVIRLVASEKVPSQGLERPFLLLASQVLNYALLRKKNSTRSKEERFVLLLLSSNENLFFFLMTSYLKLLFIDMNVETANYEDE